VKFEDYRRYDAIGLAELVARREVSASELLETALARAEAVNPQINAITIPLTEAARKTAAAPPSGPLSGVPFLLKDLGVGWAGTATSAGSKVFKDNPAAADSALGAAYREAGLVVFGKTNTPEFGLMPVTEPLLFGPSRNPWDLSRTPGGSSGGSTAAVAAGIVPAAHASDGGGSIRIPAACTGLFGMKPSRGRVSFSPNGEGWGGASVQHAATRSVRDSALLLDIASTPQPGDPYFLAPPDLPFIEEVERDPGRLRIAFTDTALSGAAIDPEVAEAVRDAARLCESLGHSVEAVRVPGDVAAMQRAAGQVMAASVAAMLDAEAERRGRPLGPDELEPLTLNTYQRGQAVPGPAYVRAITAIHAYGRAVAGLFKDYDVLLLATLGKPAIPLGWLTEDVNLIVERIGAYMPNTQAFNNSGQPGMSVPLAWSSDGLPIGIQFVAPVGEEGLLFRLAGQLERARPWFDRVAPL
jgi:Asp-tRNA(Asn)/Glu-tRNA(Gln) amidotransferase A subunit family amidase